MRRLLVFVVTLTLIASGLLLPAQTQSFSGVKNLGIFEAKPSAAFDALTDFAGAINAYRLQNGLSALALNSTLGVLAQNHSRDMAANNNLSHTGSDGRTFEQRMQGSGLQYTVALENVASNNYPNYLDKALEGWKNSPDHNANLLNNQVTHMGLGWAISSSGVWYITFDAARLTAGGGGGGGTDTAAPVSATLCRGGSATYSIDYSNSSGNQLVLSAQVILDSGVGWLRVAPPSITIPANQRGRFIVVLTANALPGTYTGKIRVSWQGGMRDHPFILTIAGPQVSMSCPTDPIIMGTTQGSRASFNIVIRNIGSCTFTSGPLAVGPSIMTLYAQFTPSQVTLAPGQSIIVRVDLTVTTQLTGPQSLQILLKPQGIEEAIATCTVMVNPSNTECCLYDVRWATSNGAPPSITLCPGESVGTGLVVTNKCTGRTITFRVYTSPSNSNLAFSKTSFTLQPGESTQTTVWVTQPIGSIGTLTWTFYVAPVCGEPQQVSFTTQTDSNCGAGSCCNWSVRWDTSDGSPPSIPLCPGETATVTFVISNRCQDKTIVFQVCTVEPDSKCLDERVSIRAGMSVRIAVRITQPTNSSGQMTWGFLIKPDCGDDRIISFVSYPRSDCVVSIRDAKVKKRPGDVITLRGYFTNDPYPLLLEDWAASKMQKPLDPDKTILLEMPTNTLSDGDLALLTGRLKDTPIGRALDVSEVRIEKRNDVAPIEFVPLTLTGTPTSLPSCKYGVVFVGGSTSECVQYDIFGNCVKVLNWRPSAAHISDAMEKYDLLRYKAGIPDSNIGVFLGKGSTELDSIYTEDGNGGIQGYNPDRYYNSFREDLERRAKEKFGGKLQESASKMAFKLHLQRIAQQIRNDCCNPCKDPEVYILITDHGSRRDDRNEADGQMGLICTSDPPAEWITDDEFASWIKDLLKACGEDGGCKPKIRIEMGMCYSGEFIDDLKAVIGSPGLKQVEVATATKDSEESYMWNGNRADQCHGIFEHEFVRALASQATPTGMPDGSFERAYEDAKRNDVAAASGVRIGGTTYKETPQYWGSDAPCCRYDSKWAANPNDPGVPDMRLCAKEIGTAKIVVTNLCPLPNPAIKFAMSSPYTEITFDPATFALAPGQSIEVTVKIIQPENMKGPASWTVNIQGDCDLYARRLIFYTYPKDNCPGEEPPPEEKPCCEWSSSELEDLKLCCPGESSQTIIFSNTCPENSKTQITFDLAPSPNNEGKMAIEPSSVTLGPGQSANVKITVEHPKDKEKLDWAFTIKACGQTATKTFTSTLKPIGLLVSDPNNLSLCNSVGPRDQRSKTTTVKATNTGDCLLSVKPAAKTSLTVCKGLGEPEVKIKPASFALAPGESKDVSITVNAWNLQCQGPIRVDIGLIGFVPDCPERQASASTSFDVTVSGPSVENHWTGVNPLPGPGAPPAPWGFPAIPCKLQSIAINPGALCASPPAPPNPTSNRVMWWGDSDTYPNITFTLTSFVGLSRACSFPKATFRIVDRSTPGSDWRLDLGGGPTVLNVNGAFPRDLLVKASGLVPGKWHWWQVEIITTNAAPCPPHTMTTKFYVMIYCTQKGVIIGPKPSPIGNFTGAFGDAGDSLVIDVGAKAYKFLDLPGVPFATKQQITPDVPWLTIDDAAGWKGLPGAFELYEQETLGRVHRATLVIDTKGLEPGWQYIGTFKLTTYWGTTKYEMLYRVCFFTVANMNYDPFPMKVHSLMDYFKPISILRAERPDENVGNYGILLTGTDLEFSKTPSGPFTDSIALSNEERLSAMRSSQPNVFVKSKRRYILPPNDLMFVTAVEYEEGAPVAPLNNPIKPLADPLVPQPSGDGLLSGAMFPIRTETLVLPPSPTSIQKMVLLPPSLDGDSVIEFNSWARPLSAISVEVEGSTSGKTRSTYQLPAKLRYMAQDTDFLINLAYDDAMGFVVVWKRELPESNIKPMSLAAAFGQMMLFQEIDTPMVVYAKTSSDVTVSPLEVLFDKVKPGQVVSKFIDVDVPKERAPMGVEVITPDGDKWLTVSASYLPAGKNRLEVIVDAHDITGENLSAISFRYEYADNDLGDDYEAVKTITIPVKAYVNAEAPNMRFEPEEIEISGPKNGEIKGTFRITNLGTKNLSGTIKTASGVFLSASISSFDMSAGARLDVMLSVVSKPIKGTFFDVLIMQSNDGDYQVPVSVEVQGAPLEIKLWIGKGRVTFNGKDRKDSKGAIIASSPAPFIDGSRTYVPLRLIGEALGATLDWEPKTGLTKRVFVKAPGRDITLYVGDPIATINGFDTPLSSPAVIRGGRTFVPFRFISEQLGAQVDWIASERAVVVTTEE